MTTPRERTAAVLAVRKFLEKLAQPAGNDIPSDVVGEAERLLRHYPSLADIELTCAMYPTCWEMPVVWPKLERERGC